MELNMDFAGSWPVIETIDMHTGGEPLRIIRSGLPSIPGKTMLEKIRFFKNNFDHLRTRLVWEPRGHADMYAAVLTEAVTAGADFGVFFLHNEGYSSMCGHAIIALTSLMARSKPLKGVGERSFIIDVPSGVVNSKAIFSKGKLQRVSFLNVPSFVEVLDQKVELENYGEIGYDLAFGGAYYAYVDAEPLGLEIHAENATQIISLGKKIKAAVNKQYQIHHPEEVDLSFLYGVIFYTSSPKKGIESRNACVFADGELDRSATGTGVSGKAALLYKKGLLKPAENIRIESLIGSVMEVKIDRVLDYHGYEAVVPEVSGKAFVTGWHRFMFDPEDPWQDGFFIR